MTPEGMGSVMAEELREHVTGVRNDYMHEQPVSQSVRRADGWVESPVSVPQSVHVQVPQGQTAGLSMQSPTILWTHGRLCKTSLLADWMSKGAGGTPYPAQGNWGGETHGCCSTLEHRAGSTFCQQPRWAAALCSRSQ